MRQRFSPQQWADWFEEYRLSGVTVKAFCKQKGVCQNSFYQWRKKLSVDSATKKANQATPFVPLVITGTTLVEIDLPGGATIRVPNDAPSLEPVLKVLLEIGAGQ